MSGFISDPFGELGGEPPGTPCVDELVGMAPGSDAHLEYLLRCSIPKFSISSSSSSPQYSIFPMFGTELDVLAPFRKVWPALRVLVDKINAVTVPTSFDVAIDDYFSEFWAALPAVTFDDEEYSLGSESEDGDGEEDN